jgi:hypothetical protein
MGGNLKLKYYFAKKETKMEYVVWVYIVSIVMILSYGVPQLIKDLIRDYKHKNDANLSKWERVTYMDIIKFVFVVFAPIINTIFAMGVLLESVQGIYDFINKPIIGYKFKKEDKE